MTSIREWASGPKLQRGLAQLKSYILRVFGRSAALPKYNHFLTSGHARKDYTGYQGNHRWTVEIGTLLAAASAWRDRVAWDSLAQAGVFVTVDDEGRHDTGETKTIRVCLTPKEK